ncbi:hypothetical protein [Saccharopolyspora shandongensis]|uniref:hypothetical protein n=1 Tax=Saccharopolyspora shandongensis TaxID=418495 RepID=UPI0033F38295
MKALVTLVIAGIVIYALIATYGQPVGGVLVSAGDKLSGTTQSAPQTPGGDQR